MSGFPPERGVRWGDRRADDGKAFRLHERIEELFRLPDDADADQIKVFYKHGTLEIRWAYWVGNAAIAVAFAGYLGVFWGDVQTTNWLAALVAVGAIWMFTLVNILGARETGVAQVLTTVLEARAARRHRPRRALLHRGRVMTLAAATADAGSSRGSGSSLRRPILTYPSRCQA